jgi:tetratricopeptide (TPR) repeat protein
MRLALALIVFLLAANAFAQSGETRKISPGAARYFAEARAAESRADWAEAARNYSKAVELASDWAEALVNLGVVYNRLGKTDDAIRAFTRAAELDPKLPGAWLNLAITYFRAQSFREAEQALRRSLALQPTNDQAAHLLALALFAQERFDETTALAEKLLATGPNDSGILEVAGRAYLKLKRYDPAVQVFERRAQLQPTSAEVYLLLGEARDNAGDSERAIEEFRRAIALSESSPIPEAHYGLGYILWKQRRYNEAEAELRKELERDAGHARSIYYLGNIALARGDWRNARLLLERAAQMMPQDFLARYDLAKALLLAGEAARAIEQLQAAIALNAKHSGAHYQLALALRRLNREEEAQREFAIARQLNELEREDLERKVQGEERKKKP